MNAAPATANNKAPAEQTLRPLHTPRRQPRHNLLLRHQRQDQHRRGDQQGGR